MAETDTAPLPSSITFPLSSPLTTHAGVQNELKISAPTAGDLVDVRTNPYSIYSDGRYEARHDLMMKILSKLCGVDELILRGMSARDWNVATRIVRDYVGEVGNLPALFRES